MDAKTGTYLVKYTLGHTSIRDATDRADQNHVSHSRLHGSRERHLVGRPGLYLLCWVIATAGDIEKVYAMFCEDRRKSDSVLKTPRGLVRE